MDVIGVSPICIVVAFNVPFNVRRFVFSSKVRLLSTLISSESLNVHNPFAVFPLNDKLSPAPEFSTQLNTPPVVDCNTLLLPVGYSGNL